MIPAPLSSPLAAAVSCALTSDGKWLVERALTDEYHFRTERVIFDGRTRFQHVLIVDTAQYGRMLVVDGETQSAQHDEYQYHEALVHPALIEHPAPRDVLVIGGGEGATLREVLRHSDVRRATMVDIDGELIELARRHLGDWHHSAFDDPRTDLHIADGLNYLKGTRDRFDVAIVDVCDYVEGTAVEGIYSRAFFDAVKSVLRPGGIVVVQGGELGPEECDEHVALAHLVEASFGNLQSYSTFIESFWSEWSFLIGGEQMEPVAQRPAAAIDAALVARGLERQLRFYDGGTHTRMFTLTKDVRDALTASRSRRL